MVTIKRGCQLNNYQWNNLLYYLPTALNDAQKLEKYKITNKPDNSSDFKLALQDSFCRVIKNSLKVDKKMLQDPQILQKIEDEIKKADENKIIASGIENHSIILARYPIDNIASEIRFWKMEENCARLAKDLFTQLDFLFNGIGSEAEKAPEPVAKKAKKLFEDSLAGYRTPGLNIDD